MAGGREGFWTAAAVLSCRGETCRSEGTRDPNLEVSPIPSWARMDGGGGQSDLQAEALSFL